jgi:hypothetical protein
MRIQILNLRRNVMNNERAVSEFLEAIDQFGEFCEKKIADDIEKEMEMRYWEYVEQIARMTK